MKDLLSFAVKISDLKKYKKPIFISFSIIVIFQILGLVTPYITGLIVDNFINGIDTTFVLSLIGLAFLLEMLSNFLFMIKEKIDYEQFYFDFSQDLKKLGIRKLFSFSVGQHITKNSGVKDTVINRGINQIKHLVRYSIYDFLPVVIATLVTLVALFVLDFQIALVCLTFFLLLLWYQTALLKKTHPKMVESEKLGQNVSKSVWNTLHNVLLVKNSGREDHAGSMINNEVSVEVDFNKSFWSYYMVRLIRSGRFIIMGTTLVMILSAWKINAGVLTPGMFVVVSMWASMFFSNALRFQWMYRVFADSMPAIQEFKDLYEIKPDITNHPHATKPETFEGSIEFKNVSFAYPDDDGEGSVLKNISFTIKPQETIGVVGRSGSGKSTLTKLLLRNYDPNKGSILIDGHNLKKLDLSHYLQNVGYVEQSTQLFDMTIAQNLSFITDKELSTQDLKMALKQAGLLEFVEKLPKGLDTQIGEQGIKLSGGQRQRLAIARALVKKPAILILDEATASLDTEKEREIQEAIDNLAKENISATKIVIAHRLSTIVNADRIFVFDEGKIVDMGTHAELLERSEIYTKLHNLQHMHIV